MSTIHLLFLMFIVVFRISSTEGWVGITFLKPNKDYPNKCYDPKGKEGQPLILGNAELYYPPWECYELRCYISKGQTLLEATGCGLVTSGIPDCTVVEDLEKKYPLCCPRIECDSKENI